MRISCRFHGHFNVWWGFHGILTNKNGIEWGAEQINEI
jgi:hypothetical protein